MTSPKPVPDAGQTPTPRTDALEAGIHCGLSHWSQALPLCRELEKWLSDATRIERERCAVVDAAVELEAYLAAVNTPERQSIVFQCPDDDSDGLAIAGLCERLTNLSKAIRELGSGR